jgi:hypothetical protein
MIGFINREIYFKVYKIKNYLNFLSSFLNIKETQTI